MLDPAAVTSDLLRADPESARIEEAGINAAQPPEQLLVDGWLLRFCAGKAKRARSVCAISAGRYSLDEKLQICGAYYERAGMPLIFRITPFSQPEALDRFLQGRGFIAFDESRVMVATIDLARIGGRVGTDLELRAVDAEAFAQTVGALRESPAGQIRAHQRRLQISALCASTRRAVVYCGDEPVAAGQAVAEGALAGLYDIVTAPQWRGRGIATALTAQLMRAAHACGARTAYLQVDAGNACARHVYHRLGFADRYAYWYRQAPASMNEHH